MWEINKKAKGLGLTFFSLLEGISFRNILSFRFLLSSGMFQTQTAQKHKQKMLNIKSAAAVSNRNKFSRVLIILW